MTATRRGFTDWPERVDARTALAVGVAPSSKWLAAWGLPDDLRGATEFCERLLEAVATAAAVKVQTPFFERFGPDGLRLLAWFLAECAGRDVLTVADCKRCDAEDTMTAYADIYLGAGSVLGADAVTVAPFLGLGALTPLVATAVERRCVVFVLVRTSNHEAGLQLSRDTAGRTVSERLADEIEEINRGRPPGDGLGSAAALVGAPAEAAASLLRRMPGTLVSLPGLGRPGRTVDEFAAVIGTEGGRVLLPVTSGVLQAGPDGVAERVRRWQRLLRPLTPEGAR